jgi:hypothetical protein
MLGELDSPSRGGPGCAEATLRVNHMQRGEGRVLVDGKMRSQVIFVLLFLVVPGSPGPPLFPTHLDTDAKSPSSSAHLIPGTDSGPSDRKRGQEEKGSSILLGCIRSPPPQGHPQSYFILLHRPRDKEQVFHPVSFMDCILETPRVLVYPL